MLTVLVSIVVGLIVVGILLWIINSCPFIDGSIKPIITWVVYVLAALWIISVVLGFAPIDYGTYPLYRR